MKVLVVGSGGREHPLCWKLAQSEQVEKIYCAPGNGGTAVEYKTDNVSIAATDLDGLRKFALEEKIDLTVVGPELPLSLGITDFFNERGLLVFGPTKAAARLEWCKVFAKQFMWEHGIPTAPAFIAYDITSARGYIHHHFLHGEGPLVVKACGLAAGKGVSVCWNKGEALSFLARLVTEKVLEEAGCAILLEHYLDGEEVSFQCLIDGERILPLETSQDEKRLWDGRDAPMTGGMGATSPAPIVTPELEERIMRQIIEPAVSGMNARGTPYCGVLYAGLMIVKGRPHVLEFNSRFGDPETQPLMVRFKSDLFPLLYGTALGDLSGFVADWSPDPAACVVVTSRGYPGQPLKTGLRISGFREAKKVPGVTIFHASSTRRTRHLLTGTGGRVLNVVATASSWGETIGNVYAAVREIDWGPGRRFVTGQKPGARGPDMDDLRKSTDPGPYCRWDIGRKLLIAR